MEEKKTTRKPRTQKAVKDTAVSKVETVVAEPTVFVEEEAHIEPKRIDPNQIITVYNGFHGVMYYRSRKTGELYQWDGFGDEQDMELSELKNAKSSSKKHFINNWFMFDEDDAWVIEYLGVGRYYKNAVSIDGFDDIFTKSPAEIAEIVNGMSAGQKRSAAYRAQQMIEDGEIDSMKKISVLENCLGVELVEH